MLLTRFGAFALAVITVHGFKDTSPFFLFSTSELLASSPNLISAASLSKIVTPQLELCSSDTYVVVSQPGVNVADYRDRAAPYLRMKMRGDDKSVRSSLAVSEVLGELSGNELSRTIQEKCGAGHLRVDASSKKIDTLTERFHGRSAEVRFLTAGSFTIAEDTKPRVINLDFPALPAGVARSQKLVENDAFLASVLDLLSSNRYTVLYTTTPSNTAHQSISDDSETYEMEPLFQTPVHLELKRDLYPHKRASDGNITLPDGPLFERYQYLNPGLFMGLLVSFILLSILYVAISAVASLKVSYAAFDKEMGPSGQKKQAQ